jgi:hypothetical protein
LFAANEAVSLGHGVARAVAAATGIARSTITISRGPEVSERRVCQSIGVDGSRCATTAVDLDDSIIRIRLREVAAVRRCFGYRRLHNFA